MAYNDYLKSIMTEQFSGFSKETILFFKNLQKNNNKTWFQDHKEDYDTFVLKPARALVVSLGAQLKKLSPGIQAIPKVGKSIFRINRDIRFSKDKSPYKTSLMLWFWEGKDRKGDSPGLFFKLENNSLTLGVGMHEFSKELLTTYRESVADNKKSSLLTKPLSLLLKNKAYNLGGSFYKKVPRGFDPEHKNANLLRHKGLYVGITTAIPSEITSSKFLQYCYAHYKQFYPVHKWLVNLAR